jgi:flagellar protein FlaC
LGFN